MGIHGHAASGLGTGRPLGFRLGAFHQSFTATSLLIKHYGPCGTIWDHAGMPGATAYSSIQGHAEL